MRKQQMTEEIIIDGVNVTGCCFLFKFRGFDEYNEEYTEWSCNIGGFSCENRDNCYYKQLKRLEQENKKLKKDAELDKVQLEAYFIGEELLVKENQRLRSALEEIRKIADNVSDTFDTPMVLAVKIQNKINEVLNEN